MIQGRTMSNRDRRHWIHFLFTNSDSARTGANRCDGGTTRFFYVGVGGDELDGKLGEGYQVIKVPTFTILEDTRDFCHIAHECRKILLRVQPEGPYLLGGYCDNGLVAYELARILMEEGREIGLVVLVETLFPMDDHSLHARALLLVRRLLLALVRPSLGFGYLVRRIKERIRRRRNGSTSATKSHSEYFRNMHIALSRYQVQPYRGHLTLIFGYGSYRRFLSTLGWKGVVRGGVEKHLVDGDHRCSGAADKIREILSRQTSPRVPPPARPSPPREEGRGESERR